MSKTTQQRGRSSMLSVDQVAEELGVSSKTVRRQITAGLLPKHCIGRCLRISQDDLALYRQRRRDVHG